MYFLPDSSHVVEEVNRLCPSEKDVSPGHVVMALNLDTLSGRSRLYRLEPSFKGMDFELLLGVDIPSSKLNDDAAGRVLDAYGKREPAKC